MCVTILQAPENTYLYIFSQLHKANGLILLLNKPTCPKKNCPKTKVDDYESILAHEKGKNH